jgi:uncharacterized protein YjbI with pentapeptide repeats
MERKASLQGMQLEGVNLAGADLREMDFSEANLSFVSITHDEATRRSLLFCIRWKVSLSSSQHPTPG